MLAFGDSVKRQSSSKHDTPVWSSGLCVACVCCATESKNAHVSVLLCESIGRGAIIYFAQCSGKTQSKKN